MEVKALYYSFIKDALKKRSDIISIPENSTVETFLYYINDHNDNALEDYIFCNGGMGANLVVLVNSVVVDYSHILSDGDEVSLFLQIAGG